MTPFESLQATLGEDVVEVHAPHSVEGALLEATFRPRDGDELSRGLAALSEQRLPVLVRGGGTRLQIGSPCPAARALLATEGIVGIDEFDSDDGVVHVRAGTPLAVVAKAVSDAGWELPLDPPGATTTVGGAIAAAATGPRRQHFGSPRDCVLGLQVVLASGERTRCGGRVVKNVTGYDMAKLYTGSFGSLGVIEGAWLRLRPRPSAVTSAVASLPASDPERSIGIGLAAARRSSARVVAVVSGSPAAGLAGLAPGDDAWVLVVEYAGEAPAVSRDLAWLCEEAGAREVPEASGLAGRLRELQGTGEVRARLSVLPSQLPELLALLASAAIGTVSYPGLGIVYAFSDRDAQPLLEAARASDADILLEALPLEARREVDVFGDPGARLPVARALKQRFDPLGILNPGRFQGRL
ncbi:MAG: FAD-binding oxidoreductase [Myxococcota bacterium]|nr:FAD-binding oxidoreductase [Myxococcota bacterium]